MRRVLNICLVLALLVSCGHRDTQTSTTPVPSGPPTFAYVTDKELVLERAGGAVARAPIQIRDWWSSPPSAPALTSDARFVYTQAGENLAAIDIQSGATRAVRCGCALVRPGFGSNVTWFDEPNRIMALDLADPDAQPAVQRQVDLPVLEAGEWGTDTAVIGVRGPQILLKRPTQRIPQTSHPILTGYSILAVEGDGPARQVASATLFPGQMPTPSPDGNKLAFQSFVKFGRFDFDSEVDVTVIDLDTGRIDKSGPPQPAPDADHTIAASIRTLWWDTHGTLTIAFRIREYPKQSSTVPFRDRSMDIWQRQHDGTWHDLDSGPAIYVAPLDPDMSLVLEPVEKYTWGSLYLIFHKTRAQIASPVFGVIGVNPR
ncbi:hypothetical protein FZI91_14125 [Mycobacterium sp. CBMA271]|uniref:hypothetical protein n=1 Tax=Mycobacteroides sp. CBMA 326 TaxID=1904945 RepID=UPI0012DEA044|nr:hypothetical protein [Mycobacteroides sp. CBMA 326]MUM22835.1 hypothetical protein [Mycobacteroides sp. CBMA 271]